MYPKEDLFSAPGFGFWGGGFVSRFEVAEVTLDVCFTTAGFWSGGRLAPTRLAPAKT